MTCPEPSHRVAILESGFHSASSGSVHCQVRADYLRSARLLTREEAAVTIKQCEAAAVTPALIAECQGGVDCLVRADPVRLAVAECSHLHVALRIIFTCMDQVGSLQPPPLTSLSLSLVFQSNFLPRYVENKKSPEEEQEESRELGQSQSEPELVSTSVVDPDQNSQITPEQTARSQPDKIRTWLLQLVYHLIYETSKILYFLQKVN